LIPEVSTETQEPIGFETKYSFVYAGYAGNEDGQPFKAIIKEDDNAEMSQRDKQEEPNRWNET
jgi:hypothetical protein